MHGAHTPNAGETGLPLRSSSVVLQYLLSETYPRVVSVFHLLRDVHRW